MPNKRETLSLHPILSSQGVVQNCHHFHERTHRILGGRGSRAAVRYFKMSFKLCVATLRRHLKIMQSTILVGREGGHKKEYYMYTIHNVDNSGRPLSGPESCFTYLARLGEDRCPYVACRQTHHFLSSQSQSRCLRMQHSRHLLADKRNDHS